MLVPVMVHWDRTRLFAGRKEQFAAIEAFGGNNPGLRIRAKIRTGKGFGSFSLFQNQGDKGGQTFEEICNSLAELNGVIVFVCYVSNGRGEYGPSMSLKGVYTVDEYAEILESNIPSAEEDGELDIPESLRAFVAPPRTQSTSTTEASKTMDLSGMLNALHNKGGN